MRTIVFVTLAALFVAGCSAPKSTEGAVSPGSGTAAAPADASTAAAESKTATWGERYTWPDGLAIEVSAPKPCTPSEAASPQNAERAVTVTVKVVNGGKEPFNTGTLMIATDAQHAGVKAEPVYDFGGPCGEGLASTTVLPGKTFETAQTFAVGKAPGEMQLVFQPRFDAAKAIYVGQA